MTKITPKDLWKATQLEYLHNCFIGISHLTCSNPTCPLVLNWGEIEKKQSKKGKCAFYLVSQKDNKWIVVDLTNHEENDLGDYENIEIKFKSGKTQRSKAPEPLNKGEWTKPTNYQEQPKQQVLVSGWTDKKEPKKEWNTVALQSKDREIFLKDEEIILFFNNSSKTPNLLDAEAIYLEDLWDIKEKIKWDRDKSKKKVFLRCENDPSEDTQAKKIDASEKDYLFYVADPSTTNEIKEMVVYSPSKGTEERTRLYHDFHEDYSELKEVYGIRHNLQAKEERQNNPEIDIIKSPFLALERDKWRERMKSIKDFEDKKGCDGIHTLSYGSLGEHQQEILLEKEVENLEDDKSEQSEQEKEIPKKEILIESHKASQKK